MGRTKQTMPTPGRPDAQPVVAAAFDAIAASCDSILVVTGHDSDAVVEALGERDFRPVRVDPDAEMLASVRAGIRAALARRPGAPLLVHPADHPFVAAGSVARIVQVAREHPHRAVMPCRADASSGGTGRAGGHPVLVPASIAQRILDEPIDGGLRAFWLAHPECAVRVAIDDPGCFRDLDAPDDASA